MQEGFNNNVYRYLLGAVVFMVSLGTVFYHQVEHFSWLDSYYFSVVTLATVGYGDLSPATDIGKIFTTLYIFAGVGLIGTFISYSLRRRANRAKQRQEKTR